ncbi:hypothetical protein DTO027B5_1220 [Paecilomyces variotii]|nr:hypothetical protein DTO169C6_7425 [Paecilomyces variotii]KAJ9324082.1 hypothetical protein DTO027B3_4898 [Paecilomyces variotii]KAJ9337046.1 hypothetical protein DTO027B5_1220 [Paecilomyces variotii]KAJ9396576.1 hypothetical protein DTO282F9_6547 [Paecilomyces variotii]KAJ9407300.1 hypothetical protein DTO045G8_4864 [Paecilomyces variotii]
MMAKPPSPPHFLYVPASSMASRRDIEQSSYSTTPALSQGAHTPPSGQMTYYLPEEELAAVDDVLRAKLIHGGLERVVLLEANDATTPKEINVEQSGGGGEARHKRTAQGKQALVNLTGLQGGDPNVFTLVPLL